MDKINWNVDQFILGAVSGTVSAAIYAIAVQLMNMYTAFSTAISSVLLPKITKMQANDASDEEFTNIFIKTGRIQFLITSLIVTGFVIFGKEFIEIIWVGKDYTISYYIACILMISISIPLIQNVGLNILQVKNKYKYRTILLSIIAIFNVVISIPLAKMFGGIGSACATAFSLFIGQGIILNIYYHKKVKIDIIRFWKEIGRMAIPAIIIFLIGFGINIVFEPTNTVIIIIQIIIYTFLYSLFMWLFAFNKYEKELILKPIKSVLERIR